MQQYDEYATVSWTATDVLATAKELNIEMTEQEAIEWLREHEKRLESAMENSGWKYMEDYL